jgi:uncharacterized membrane protein YccF (DUF307 family)
MQKIRRLAPHAVLERRDRPVGFVGRAIWFVLVGWWLGFIWVLGAWSLLLLPYPMTDAIRSLLVNLPSVMTLAQPRGTAA